MGQRCESKIQFVETCFTSGDVRMRFDVYSCPEGEVVCYHTPEGLRWHGWLPNRRQVHGVRGNGYGSARGARAVMRKHM